MQKVRGIPYGKVGMATRIRAWWLGLDSADNLRRYGDRSFLHNIWVEWKGSLLIAGCLFSFLVSAQQSNQANHILENIELNRQRYYGRQFAAEYDANAPNGVYDGVTGYSYEDESSGLRVNADNRLVSNLAPEEQRQKVEKAAISSQMVTDAQGLLNSARYRD